MKKKLLFALSLFVACAPLMAAGPDALDDDTFVSLTRSPEKFDQLPTNIEVITQEDIKKSGAQNMADLLYYATSIDVGRSGSLGSSAFVRIRGVPTSDQVQVLVDDQPIGGSSIQNININLLPIDNIERIEIVRGGASVLYGANSVGGVVHIITKKNTQPFSAGYSLEAGSFDTTIQRANASANAGPVGASVRASKTNSDGFQENSDDDDHTSGGTLSWNLNNGGRFEFSMDNTTREIGSASATPVPISDWNGNKERQPNTPDERIQNGLTIGHLNGSLPLGVVKLDTSFYGSRELYKIRTDPASDPFSTYDNRITGNDTHVTFMNGGVIGGSYERDARFALGQDGHSIVNTALYAQSSLRSGNTTVIPAIRYDHHSAFGSQINPRVSVVTKLTDIWRVTGNMARSQRNPTLVDLYEDFLDPFFPAFNFYANRNLRPEKSWSYDLGTDVTLGKFHASVTGFRNEITDRILSVDSNNDGILDTLANIAQAEIQGVETEVKTVTGPMSHTVNYTFQQARGTLDAGTNFVALRMTPHHTINYVSDVEPVQKLHVINTVKYVSSQYALDNDQGLRLPPYALWDAQVRDTWGPVTVFVKANNITNRRYAESITFGDAVPELPRSYFVGTSIQF